ncbi:MAG: hypothetical protein KDB22_11115 [Planctomycetales bacterium]|nr:hypothetical protein [Planctomycetales bacterium]
MKRRKLIFAALTAGATSAIKTRVYGSDTKVLSVGDVEDRVDSKPRSFEFNKPLQFNLNSATKRWKEDDVVLVRLGEITFSYAPDTRALDAKLVGTILTFDKVDYDISVVVFDKNDRMLGAAKGVCEVPRVWYGRCGLQSITIDLDFGSSNAFRDAKSFRASISDRDVLTPDDWQDDGQP